MADGEERLVNYITEKLFRCLRKIDKQAEYTHDNIDCSKLQEFVYDSTEFHILG